MKRIPFALLILLFSVASYAGQEIEFPKFDEELAEAGITANYSESGFRALVDERRRQTGILREKEAEKNESGVRSGPVGRQVDEIAAVDPARKADRIAAYRTGKSLLYSVRSYLAGVQNTKGFFSFAYHFLQYSAVSVPYVQPAERDSPVGPKQAAAEAWNLVDPSEGREFASPDDVADFPVERIAALDVRSDDTMWYQQAELDRIKASSGSAWHHLEARTEALVGEDLGEPYSIDRARRVLFLDAVKDTATSPKVDTKDAWGLEWTLKWGEEIHSEPVANRLYVELGGKFTDLAYSNAAGAAELLLVLGKPGPPEADEKPCERIPDLATLRRCLRDSPFEFELKPYVLESGTITEAMVSGDGSPLSRLPRKERDKALGRDYVVFKESMVELHPSVATRLGAVSFNVGGAAQDRVKRGLVVFSYWLGNKDPKDDNNRGVVFDGRYLECIHDLGASLGDLRHSAYPNELDWHMAKRRVMSRGRITFSDQVLYLPKAFRAATFADALWMARKIVALPPSVLHAAVDASRWPGFQVEAMYSKLLSRRNNLAEVFGIGEQVPYSRSAPEEFVPLMTREDRARAARKYHLEALAGGDIEAATDRLEQAMKEAGVEFDGTGRCGYEDAVLRPDHGAVETVACERSVLVALLENTLRPSGLARRVQRGQDDKPLGRCTPTVPRRRSAR
jgi:hypothetical protein